MNIPRQTETEQIQHLPSSALFDMARNESAQWTFRIAATKLLIAKMDPRAKHPELEKLVYAVAEGVIGGSSHSEPASVPGSGVPPNLSKPDDPVGPFRASVTTATMSQPEAVQALQNQQSPVAVGLVDDVGNEIGQVHEDGSVSGFNPTEQPPDWLESMSIRSPVPAAIEPKNSSEV